MSLPSSYNYETVYILKPGVSDSNAEAIHSKVDNVITKFQGKLKGRDDWGVKELAYMIEKQTNGRYCVINYTGTSGVVAEIERHFRISDDVLRFITIMQETTYDYDKAKRQMALVEEQVKAAREARKKDRPDRFDRGGDRGDRPERGDRPDRGGDRPDRGGDRS